MQLYLFISILFFSKFRHKQCSLFELFVTFLSFFFFLRRAASVTVIALNCEQQCLMKKRYRKPWSGLEVIYILHTLLKTDSNKQPFFK